MRNIIKIFTSDVKRLATNVVAVVVIMGLAVIPCLYAWFNILSNWDPYGEAATANLNVVVATCDQGVEIEGIELNVGDMIVSNLKENKTIGWVFVDTEQEAVEGVYSGDYYAGLVIDETFSEDLISFLGGNLENPKITYYENDKKNAIAPKITGKVKTTVQEEINSAFVSTMAKSIMEVSEYVVTTDGSGQISLSVLDKMQKLDADLVTYIAIMDSYISIIDASSSLMDAVAVVSGQLDDVMAAGRSIANGADLAADTATDAMGSVSDIVTQTLDDVQKELNNVNNMVNELLYMTADMADITEKQVDALIVAVDGLKEYYNTSMKKTIEKYPTNKDIQNANAEVNKSFDNIIKDLNDLKNASKITSEDANRIARDIQNDFDACNTNIAELTQTYKYTVEPQLNQTMDAIQKSIYEIQDILNYSSDSIEDVVCCLGSYPDMLSIGKDRLVASKEAAVEMEKQLQELMADMGDLETNDQYATLIALIESDPKLIADFISSPVELNQTPVYAIENNGSATAPFYVVLSIWFGSLILIAIIHTGLKTNPGCKNLKNHQAFFGRYITFYLIGQLQTVITVLGCFLYVGIQCKHPIMFWFAASFTSFTFTIFMYSLSYAFGNVGEAAAVVLMVIQVAGSGGTFPVEVLPKVFQLMYEYMPFAHGMNALRECIAGTHGADYWLYLAGMIAYIAIALVFGLVISIPCKKLNEKIEESKERTDLLL